MAENNNGSSKTDASNSSSQEAVRASSSRPSTEGPDASNATDNSILKALQNLMTTLSQLDDRTSFPLSHYRYNNNNEQELSSIPREIPTAYHMLQQGAQLVHATSTKYTLLSNIQQQQQQQQPSSNNTENMMSKDLLQGCQFVATACVVLHQQKNGCSPALRRSVKHAARAILHTCWQLVECTTSVMNNVSDTDTSNKNLAAQRTGAVWQTCDVILENKLPIGNRNAMRRELFTYTKECNETLQEFQDMIDKGPILTEEETTDDQIQQETTWEGFLAGQTDQYTDVELGIADACLYLIKCSRGCINVVLKACEEVGKQIEMASNDASLSRLEWIATIHEKARLVGDGMTDLGSNMYPPLLQLDVLLQHVERQAQAMDDVLQLVIHARLGGDDDISLELGNNVLDLANKINGALEKRRGDAVDAIHRVMSSQTCK